RGGGGGGGGLARGGLVGGGGGGGIAGPLGGGGGGKSGRAGRRLSRCGCADLGDRRCDHGAAGGPRAFRRTPRRWPHVARRAFVGPARRGRTLRLPPRERQIGAARQRASETAANRAGSTACTRSARHHRAER